MEAPTVEKQKVGPHAVRLVRRYPATPEQLYRALISADSIAKWFGPNDEMAVTAESNEVEGGSYRIVLTHQGGNQHIVGGHYTKLEPSKYIEFTWKWEGEAMAQIGDTTVSYSIKGIDGGSELTLNHSGFPSPEAAGGHTIGWNGGIWRLGRLFGDSLLQESSVALALNRKLYENSITGISDTDYKRQPSKTTNHLLWVAGHIASTRAQMASLMGAPIEDEMSVFSKALDPDATYPSIDEVKAFFVKATGKILEALPSVSAEALRAPAPFALPINDSTLRGAIAFFVQHEAYHVGQMGLLRKYLGQEATSYS